SSLVAVAPPANDICSAAEIIPGNAQFPYLTATIPDIRGATSNNDPVPDDLCVASVTNGVWYKFTPTATALYTFSVSFDTATTVPDTAMAIYTSANGCSGPFTALDCNDYQSGRQSAISINLSS